MRRVGRTLVVVVPNTTRNNVRPDVFEKPLDTKAADKMSKGPPVAHSLPVYKTAHKLNYGIKWKTANVVTNVCGSSDYRLRETHGEGKFDDTGMYRDWLYGDERRYANYAFVVLFSLCVVLYLYTMYIMGKETWDIPATVIATYKKKQGATVGSQQQAAAPGLNEDALLALKRPPTVTKAT